MIIKLSDVNFTNAKKFRLFAREEATNPRIKFMKQYLKLPNQLFDRKVVFRINFHLMMLQMQGCTWAYMMGNLVNEEFSVPLVIMSMPQTMHYCNSGYIKFSLKWLEYGRMFSTMVWVVVLTLRQLLENYGFNDGC